MLYVLKGGFTYEDKSASWGVICPETTVISADLCRLWFGMDFGENDPDDVIRVIPACSYI